MILGEILEKLPWKSLGNCFYKYCICLTNIFMLHELFLDLNLKARKFYGKSISQLEMCFSGKVGF